MPTGSEIDAHACYRLCAESIRVSRQILITFRFIYIQNVGMATWGFCCIARSSGLTITTLALGRPVIKQAIIRAFGAFRDNLITQVSANTVGASAGP